MAYDLQIGPEAPGVIFMDIGTLNTDVIIVEGFYDVYPRFNCLWEAKCEHSDTCLGLTHPYIAKFGWEKDLLKPIPRTTPWKEPDDGVAIPSDAPTGTPPQGPRNHPAWSALIGDSLADIDVRLVELQLDRRRCTYRLETSAGSRVELQLTKHSDERPSLAQSKSFNLSYRALEVAEGADKASERDLLAGAVRAAIAAIRENDEGEMMLDERKGLVGAEAFRRVSIKEAR